LKIRVNNWSSNLAVEENAPYNNLAGHEKIIQIKLKTNLMEEFFTKEELKAPNVNVYGNIILDH